MVLDKTPLYLPHGAACIVSDTTAGLMYAADIKFSELVMSLL